MKRLLVYTCFALFACSCFAQRKSGEETAARILLQDTALAGAHVGISIYDPQTRRYVYEYQPHKYFVPASNIKIVTTYVAMKYLKHLLTGIRYYENDTAVYLVPTGDPTLLHRDFTNQPVIDFLKSVTKKIYITDQNWKDRELGKGWSWDDFTDEYMTERNALPVYGNSLKWIQERFTNNSATTEQSISVYSVPEVNWKVGFEPNPLKPEFAVKRDRMQNVFTITEGTEDRKEVIVPFITNGLATAIELLRDTAHVEINVNNHFVVTNPQKKAVTSQPLDSVLRPMMYHSDNFFAEQLLLMAAEERFGVMDAQMIIDTLLENDFNTMPDPPVWVDGSGLSRYNLLTPRNFTWLLDTMRVQFGMDRLKAIFPTADSGTMKGYFINSRGKKFYAKTGSMSGVMALSGYMYTRNNRLLIFSVLVNNFTGRVSSVKRAVERFLVTF
jgi:serine-type D-Ala-D-Ala carboxypeptidase/endopeptidase (penicillin-binding protein 4)